jgi:2,5-dihydroxypyridine 5,6-dioxygenase
MDSRMIEWMNAARVAVDFSTRLQPGEETVIVTDPMVREYPGCGELIDAVSAAARYAGGEVTLVEFMSRTIPNEELPATVAAAMAAAKVVYILPTRGAIHTQATHLAKKAGARILVLGSASSFGTGDVLARLAPRSKEELEEWARLTTKLADRFKRGGTLHVTTKKGTDLTCRVGDLQVHTMDALYRPPGEFTHFIPGLSGGGVTPGSTQGVLVADASITPIARPLTNEQPVAVHVRDGLVVDVDGGPAAAEWMLVARALNDPTAFNAAEYGFGCHPRAKVPFGGPTNDERLYGGFHLGIGSSVTFGGPVQSKWHIDACATAATATLNGELLIEDGVYRP